MIATQNISASLYSVLTYQIKFPLPLPSYYIFKNFSTTPFIPTPPPPLPCIRHSRMKERPGLSKRPLRMSAPLHSWKINECPSPSPPQTRKGVLIWKSAMSAESLIQVVCKNDEIFFSEIFFVIYNNEIYKHIL